MIHPECDQTMENVNRRAVRFRVFLSLGTAAAIIGTQSGCERRDDTWRGWDTVISRPGFRVDYNRATLSVTRDTVRAWVRYRYVPAIKNPFDNAVGAYDRKEERDRIDCRSMTIYEEATAYYLESHLLQVFASSMHHPVLRGTPQAVLFTTLCRRLRS